MAWSDCRSDLAVGVLVPLSRRRTGTRLEVCPSRIIVFPSIDDLESARRFEFYFLQWLAREKSRRWEHRHRNERPTSWGHCVVLAYDEPKSMKSCEKNLSHRRENCACIRSYTKACGVRQIKKKEKNPLKKRKKTPKQTPNKQTILNKHPKRHNNPNKNNSKIKQYYFVLANSGRNSLQVVANKLDSSFQN